MWWLVKGHGDFEVNVRRDEMGARVADECACGSIRIEVYVLHRLTYYIASDRQCCCMRAEIYI